MKFYILDDEHNVVTTDRETYIAWMTANKYEAPLAEGPDGRRYHNGACRVGADRVGDAWVSTVFLGLDHGTIGGPPILFETMIFGTDSDDTVDRYATWDAALKGHRRIVAAVATRDLP